MYFITPCNTTAPAVRAFLRGVVSSALHCGTHSCKYSMTLVHTQNHSTMYPTSPPDTALHSYTGPLRISPKARLQPHIHQCEGIQFARNTASHTVQMQFASPHALVGMPQGCPKYRSIVVTNSTQLLVPHPYLSCVKVTIRNSE